MKKSRLAVWLILVPFAWACSQSNRPPISDATFEDVLYDMYCAESFVDYNNQLQAEKEFKENYHRAILDQHHISRADFDSTLSWYAAHLEEFVALYDRIVVRLKAAKAQAGELSQMLSNNQSEPGDTVNLWKSPNTILYTAFDPNHSRLVKFQPDGNYQNGDRFTFRFFALYAADTTNGLPQIEMSLAYANDSVQRLRLPIESGRTNTLIMKADTSMSITSLSCKFRFPLAASPNTTLFIKDIELWREHEITPTAAEEEAPTAPNDSITEKK